MVKQPKDTKTHDSMEQRRFMQLWEESHKLKTNNKVDMFSYALRCVACLIVLGIALPWRGHFPKQTFLDFIVFFPMVVSSMGLLVDSVCSLGMFGIEMYGRRRHRLFKQGYIDISASHHPADAYRSFLAQHGFLPPKTFNQMLKACDSKIH